MSTSRLVTLYSGLLFAAGMILLFAPEVGSEGARTDPRTSALTQVLAAGLLGFAAASWTARESILGGIYGRAVVVGNQVFAFVGALVLLRAIPGGHSAVGWALLVLLVCGATLFSVLLYRHPTRAAPKQPAE